MMRRIYLIGYMGVGKSTLGRGVAKALGLTFIDLDHYIEQRTCKQIPQLFAERGEEGFRALEQHMLQEVSQIEDVVVATGGGAPCFYDNMALMNRTGITVLLEATPQTLWSRLRHSHNSRPLLKEKNDAELMEYIVTNLALRNPYYTQSQLRFQSDQLECHNDIQQAVAQLSSQLKAR